jgi:putrescine aminotransferase
MTHVATAQHQAHINPEFIKLLGMLGYGRVFTKAQGVELWDDQGRSYMDFLAGFGSVNVGHNHPYVVGKIVECLTSNPMHFCHTGPSVQASALAFELSKVLDPPLRRSLFSNSGAEAVEAGIKLARAATGRRGLLSCRGGFHGSNLSSLSIMDEKRWRTPFEPLLEHCTQIPFGDLAALKQALQTFQPSAFVVEPIQAEAGVVIPPSGYLAEAQALCRHHGTVLVLDEVQTGLGRTGAMFAYQREGFVPDVICLAKALSGGIAPIAVTVTNQELHDRAYGRSERFDLHSSTFAGNAIGAVAAMATLDVLRNDKLCDASDRLGKTMLLALQTALRDHPLVAEVRGRGLFIGVALQADPHSWLARLAPDVAARVNREVVGQWICCKLLERGLVCQPSSHRWDVLKLQPPLTISSLQCDHAVKIVVDVFDQCRDAMRIAAFAGVRVGQQWSRKWAF